MAKYCESLGILTFALSLASILTASNFVPPSLTEIKISLSDALDDMCKSPVVLLMIELVPL